MEDIFKAWLAGILIALGSLAFGICATIGGTLAYKALGAFLFAVGLCAICEGKLNLVTGKFGLFYDGSWSFR